MDNQLSLHVVLVYTKHFIYIETVTLYTIMSNSTKYYISKFY